MFTGALFSAYERSRLLGYLLIHAPTDAGRTNVQTEIELCTTDGQLKDLAQLYIDHFIRIFKSTQGRTPTTSSRPSRSSFDVRQQETLKLLREAPKNHIAVKELVLRRDNHRCLVTGKLDMKEYFRKMKIDPTFRGGFTVTQASRILPDCSNQELKLGSSEHAQKLNWTSSTWAVLERFGQINLVSDEFNECDTYCVDNVMTLDLLVHNLFHRLVLWFEPEGDILNQYRVCSIGEPDIGIPNPPIVTFTSSDPEIPVPNARFLRLHAACAKIANLSGASEYIESTLHDMEEMEVLATDGTSADVLNFALGRIPVSIEHRGSA
ncbi:hypothetical protein FRB93_005667 [Tulasnella sp. JGI-2019a]|nr:hypothetical protein FRB93_005667 [Tulasnella sp. JGI-2019a]